jgi:Ser-tRNA(Ala) deacylase AlaX
MESEGRESNIIDQQIDFTDISLLIEEDQENVPFSSESFEQEKSEKSSSGFCVKEYEQKLNNLSKENFNLKLRLYFLEEKNPNIPQGAEALYKENIDLKVKKLIILKFRSINLNFHIRLKSTQSRKTYMRNNHCVLKLIRLYNCLKKKS